MRWMRIRAKIPRRHRPQTHANDPVPSPSGGRGDDSPQPGQITFLFRRAVDLVGQASEGRATLIRTNEPASAPTRRIWGRGVAPPRDAGVAYVPLIDRAR